METPNQLPESNLNLGVYLLTISPLHVIEPHYHPLMIEKELIISEGIICQNQMGKVGEIREWGDQAHFYTNESNNQEYSILCIDSPIFNKSHEIILQPHEAQQVYQNPNPGKLTNLIPSLLESKTLKFTFPGSFHCQINELQINQFGSSSSPSFPRPDAVLIFAFNSNHQLLLVEHHKRGWELMGGKLESDETPEQAAYREAKEEGAVQIDTKSIRLIGQYKITEPGNNQTSEQESKSSILHTKSVYFARIAEIEPESHLTMETKSRRFLDPPSWTDILADRPMKFSALLKDNVYPACLYAAKRIIELDH